MNTLGTDNLLVNNSFPNQTPNDINIYKEKDSKM